MNLSNNASIGKGKAAVGRWVSDTPGFLRQQLWVWPLIAAAMLAFVGIWVRGKIERAMEAHVATNLQTILNANTEALREWASTMRSLAEVLAADDRVRELAASQLAHAQVRGTSPAALMAAPGMRDLGAYLQPAAEARGFKGYALLDTNLVIVASGADQLLGVEAPPTYTAVLKPCLAGTATVTRPFLIGKRPGEERGNTGPADPLMFAAAPIHSRQGNIIGVLGLRILPEEDLTRILGTARSGQTGETYAFDRAGLLLSESRFSDKLKRLGLIPDQPDARSVLALELRDPLVNLEMGRLPPKRRSELPWTLPVKEALAGRQGVNSGGCRDYRGVKVVAAWTWLPDFDLGLVTQIDRKEAFAPVLPIRYGFWFLFALLTAGAGIVFLLMRVARQATLKAHRLGQYSLEEKIGSGGFGTVYRGRHALMRRPVAVKVLDPFAGATSIARFEREVQMTSELTHPNTIALYDYGRTPEGLFYYAMEYLEGLSLAVLVRQHGPQPEGRVIHILRQVCSSLVEAHARGLVHRDIKPHNILITRRGGIPDFVKVLDFGLVKGPEKGDLELTAAHATMGTPLYMSPEAVQGAETVTPPSDIYSLGAVAYELVTGQTVFSGTTLGEIILQQIRSKPEKPSDRLKRPVSADLENLLLRCLEKSPAARPTAAELETALGACAASGSWTRSQAAEWWAKNLTSGAPPTPDGSTARTAPKRDWEVICHRL